MATTFVELDVRPILEAGGEPFADIMGAVQNLKPGEGLRLLANFKPVPLFAVLGKQGFTHSERELDGGDWEVLFTPPAGGAAVGPLPSEPPVARKPATDRSSWPDPVRTMDNRDLDPPEPMVRIVAATEEMHPGEVLEALLCREPVFLIPELEKRGHAWHGGFEPDGSTYKITVRIGG